MAKDKLMGPADKAWHKLCNKVNKSNNDLVFYGEDGQKIDLDQWGGKLPDTIIAGYADNDVKEYDRHQLKERVKYLEGRNKQLENENTKLDGKLTAYRQTLKAMFEILSKEQEK